MTKIAAWMLAMVSLARAAHASPPASPDAYRAELEAAMKQGRLGQALDVGAKAISHHPDDAELRYLHGTALRQSLRTDEAIAELEAGYALARHHTSMAMELARAYASQGNIDRAVALASEAASLQPASDAAAALAQRLALEQRIRRHETTAFAPDSAAAFAHAFLTELANQPLDAVLLAHVDPEAIDRVIHGISSDDKPVTPGDRRKFLEQTAMILKSAWQNQLVGSRYVGHVITSEEPVAGGGALAHGTLLVTRTYAGVPLAELRAALDEPAAADTGEFQQFRKAFQGLGPEARDAFVERLARTSRSIHVPFFVYLVKDSAGRFMVRDLASGSPPLYVSELARGSWDVAVPGASAPSVRRKLYWQLLRTSIEVALLVMVLAALIFLVRRKLRT